MRRDLSKTSADEAPLATNDFFRRVEQAEGDEVLQDAAEPSTDDGDEADTDELELDWEDDAPPDDTVEDDADRGIGLSGQDAPEPGRSVAVPVGWVLGTVGAGLGIAGTAAPDALAPVTAALGTAGVSPFGLVLAGLVVGATGALRAHTERRNAAQSSRLAELGQTVQMLAERRPRDDRDDDVVGGDVDRMLVALQRQDEKINNLTRATKLYGKPLIEISNQVSELNSQLQDSGVSKSDVEEAVVGAVTKIEKQLSERLEVVARAVHAAQEAIEELNVEFGEATRSGREENRRELADAVQQLESAVNAVTADPSAPQGLDELEGGIATIHREVQSLATSIARLESRPAAAVTAPNHAAPTAADRDAAPAAAPAGGDSGLASSIAGPRQASGKNVLGAIAKLKSMRS